MPPAAFDYKLAVKGSAISEKNVCVWQPLKFRIKQAKPLGISMPMDQLIEEIFAEMSDPAPADQNFIGLPGPSPSKAPSRRVG